MKGKVGAIVNSSRFEYFIITLIILNAAVLGLETDDGLQAEYGRLFSLVNDLVLVIFILEAGAKIYSVWPRPGRYFGDGWSLFDFSVIVFSLIPETGQFALIARMARLMRIIRLVSVAPELRLIVSTLVKSIPSMMNIILLMLIIFYIYGIAGHYLFQSSDPARWGGLGVSMLTLFQVVTLEGWADIMAEAMKANPHAWIYFISFIVLATFIVINLFIAVVINNLEEAKVEQLKELRRGVETGPLAEELREIIDRLAVIESKMANHGKDEGKPS